MMIQTITSQIRLMFMVSYYPMIRVKINKGDRIPLHALKNTTEAMIILQTLMGHLSCLLYHQDTPSW